MRPGGRSRAGPRLQLALLFLIAIAITVVAYEDSDKVTLKDFTDFQTFHHEHVILLLASALVWVIFYPTHKIQEAHVHATAILFFIGFLIVSSAFTNLPDNLTFFGAGGVSGTVAYFGGTVANLSSPRQVLAGVTVNYTLVAQGTNAALLTDANGSFLTLVPIGSYNVQFNKTGYNPVTGSVNVVASRGAHLLVFLPPSSASSPPPSPIANTNATNTPPPPAQPWWSTGTAVCLYTQENAGNGSVILHCVIKLGPISQISAGVGLVLMFTAEMVRYWYDKNEKVKPSQN